MVYVYFPQYNNIQHFSHVINFWIIVNIGDLTELFSTFKSSIQVLHNTRQS